MQNQRGKLAAALGALKAIQDRGRQAIPGTEFARSEREILLRARYLKQVIRGWYISSRPDEADGDTTAWYASMREFIASYAQARFGTRWHVNPEQSLLLRSGERSLPRQVQVWAAKGTNQTVELLHGCSLFIYKAPEILPASPATDCGGLRLVDLPAALLAASPTFYIQNPLAAQVALVSLRAPSEILRLVLSGTRSSIGGRIAGGLRAIGRASAADEILSAMRSAGYSVAEVNPFDEPVPPIRPGGRPESPHVHRLRLMWAAMRDQVIAAFPPAPGKPANVTTLLKDIAARYVADAYNSLSIEGYRVTATLIEKVRDGNWNPDRHPEDRLARDAMAARGYFETHELVKEDLVRVLKGANAGTAFRRGLSRWYQGLFSASVQAGILQAADLAGFRNAPVYIRGALHVPVSEEAVRDCMPALFELLESESNPAVRAVLGHFFFVYIHPYMDGNGRLARFLMNLMLVPAGYVWTVIPVQRREEYMKALEQASSHGNIAPLAKFVAKLTRTQSNEPLPRPR